MNDTIDKVVYETTFEDGTEITDYLATAYAEGFCEGDNASATDQIKAWSYLIAKKICFSLQGWFGRQAMNFITARFIDEHGKVNWELINEKRNKN